MCDSYVLIMGCPGQGKVPKRAGYISQCLIARYKGESWVNYFGLVVSDLHLLTFWRLWNQPWDPTCWCIIIFGLKVGYFDFVKNILKPYIDETEFKYHYLSQDPTFSTPGFRVNCNSLDYIWKMHEYYYRPGGILCILIQFNRVNGPQS